jgi:predicted nucleic acid-binding protein
MNVLVDTSVWIAHFRARKPEFEKIILQHRIFIHPFVLGELACGSLKNRTQTLLFLQNLPVPVLPSHEEVLELIEDKNLHGKGIGVVDAHLLASSLLSDCALWTLDQKLSELQKRLKIPLIDQ